MQNLKEETEGQDLVECEREFQRQEAEGTKESDKREKGILTFKGSKCMTRESRRRV